MSYKIYQGKILKNKTELKDCQEFVGAVKPVIEKRIQEENAKEILYNACAIYDMKVFGFEDDTSKSPLTAATVRTLFESRDDEEYALSFGYSKTAKSILLIPLFPRFVETIDTVEFDGLNDFAYWDNTDKDENVSELVWKHRKNSWDDILEYGVPISNSTFIITLTRKSICIPTDQQMADEFPSLEEREKYCAEMLSMREGDIIERFKKEEISMSEMITESKEVAKENMSRVSGTLDSELTFEKLKQENV